MAINFPVPATVGEEFVDPSGIVFTWNGYGWTSGGTGIPQSPDFYTKAESDANFVNVPGDTMTGALNITDPGTTVGSSALEVVGRIHTQASVVADGNLFGAGAVLGGAASSCEVSGATGNVLRWAVNFAEAMLSINRTDNAGAPVTPPAMTINRATGNATLSGTLEVPNLSINAPIAADIYFSRNAVARWCLRGSDNVTDNLEIFRYNDLGAVESTPLSINRLNNATTLCDLELKGAVPGTTSPYICFRDSVGANRGGFVWYSTSDEIQINYGDPLGPPAGLLQLRLAAWGFASTTDACYKPSGGTWTAGSDARIKTVNGLYTSGLAEVMALNPVRYTYLGNDSFSSAGESLHARSAADGVEYIGLVAQDAEQTMPELVKQIPGYIDGAAVTDMRTLDSSALVYALVNCVKELKAEIDDLRAQMAQPRA